MPIESAGRDETRKARFVGKQKSGGGHDQRSQNLTLSACSCNPIVVGCRSCRSWAVLVNLTSNDLIAEVDFGARKLTDLQDVSGL